MPRSFNSRNKRTTASDRPHREQNAKWGSTGVSHHGHDVTGIAFAHAQEPGKFEFEIDEVEIK